MMSTDRLLTDKRAGKTNKQTKSYAHFMHATHLTHYHWDHTLAHVDTPKPTSLMDNWQVVCLRARWIRCALMIPDASDASEKKLQENDAARGRKTLQKTYCQRPDWSWTLHWHATKDNPRKNASYTTHHTQSTTQKSTTEKTLRKDFNEFDKMILNWIELKSCKVVFLWLFACEINKEAQMSFP